VLKLRLSDQSPIAVNLDGKYIDRGTTSLILDGIRPGIHRIEVYAEDGGRRPIRVYTGTLRLRAGTMNVGIVDLYNRGLRLRTRLLDERDMDYAERSDRLPNPNRDDRNDRIQEDRNGEERSQMDASGDVYNDRDDREKGEGFGSFPGGRGGRDVGRPNAMNQADIDDLRSKVSSLITDSDKEQLMRRGLQDQSLYTDQVKQMMSWLSFESTRLEFAKWAFNHVIDQGNYWKLEDAFDFSSSRKEFRDSVGKR
jgi:hypothetical protein